MACVRRVVTWGFSSWCEYRCLYSVYVYLPVRLYSVWFLLGQPFLYPSNPTLLFGGEPETQELFSK